MRASRHLAGCPIRGVRGLLSPGSRRRGGALLATRIHLPEAAAASFRLDGVEKALTDRKVAVRVLTTAPPPGGEPAADPPGVRVSRWPALRDRNGYLRGYVPYLSFDLPLALRLLVAARPDVVLVEPPPTTGAVVRVIAGLRGLPYVWYAPDVWSAAALSTGAPSAVLTVVRALEAFAVRGASAVVAINDDVARATMELGAHRRDERVHVVPNGIDTTVFDATGPLPDAHERRAMGITGPYLVYAGTASEWQDAGVFVRALARLRRDLPRAQVLFLGQGSDWERIGELARRIPAGPDGAPAVIRHPILPAEDAARWQRGAAAALVSIKPGQGYDFAYPTKVLAALACGTPVLYAGVGPVAHDIAAHDLGWVSAHDEVRVAAAMAAALRADGALSERSAERAARAQRLHTWMVEHLVKILFLG